MKDKTFHALLLSIVMVAGAMTINDAFAQTNTERLITVVDTTADTNTKVSNLVNLWSNFDSNFTPILSVIDDISDELSMVSDKVSEVSSDVMAVDSKIDTLESKFDQFVATDAENTREAQTNYDNLADMLPDIQSTVDTIVDDADTSFDTISDKLDALQAQIGTFTSSITTLQDDVSEIQTELGLVQESVSDRIGPAPTDLHSDDATGKVLLSWYTQGLTKIPTGGGDGDVDITDGDSGYYTANFRFVCKSDVFIQKITTNLNDRTTAKLSYTGGNTPQLIENPIYDSGDTDRIGDGGTPTTNDVSLTANGQTLFDTYFKIGATNLQLYNRDIEYPNVVELKAGNPVEFKSSVYDPNTDVEHAADAWGPLELIVNATKNSQTAGYFTATTDVTATLGTAIAPLNSTDSPLPNGATKNQLASIEAYEVTVEYFSAAEDAKCKITPSKITPLDETDQVTFVTVNDIDGDTRLVQPYTETLDCDLNTVRITDVVGYLSGADGLNNFVTMELKAGKDTKAEFTFVNNTSIVEDESSLPFEFSGRDLTITGDLVDNSSILVQITYDSALTDGCS